MEEGSSNASFIVQKNLSVVNDAGKVIGNWRITSKAGARGLTYLRTGAQVGGAAKKGIKTASGLIVDGFAHPHALNRVIGSPGRLGVKPQAILDALKNPLKINNIVIDPRSR